MLSKLPLKVIGIVVVGLVVGAAVAFVVLTRVITPTSARASAIPTPTPTPVPQIGPIYTFKDHLVNLADPGGRRYLRVTLYVEFKPVKGSEKLTGDALTKANAAAATEIATRSPIIDDTLTMILTSKTFADIASPQGKEQMKQEMIKALNNALPGDKVVNVYLGDFVVQ